MFYEKKFKECILYSEKALETLKTFHYGNNIWFERRIIQSKKQLGISVLDLEVELKNLIVKRNEWFLKQELAQIQFEMSKYAEALQNGCEALCDHGELKMKIRLVELVGDILKEMGNFMMAVEHWLLIKEIRTQNQWKASEKNEKLLQEYQAEYTPIGFKASLPKLKTFWQSQKAAKKHIKGIIKSILHKNDTGVVGFLTAENQSFYFTVKNNFTGLNKIALGAQLCK